MRKGVVWALLAIAATAAQAQERQEQQEQEVRDAGAPAEQDGAKQPAQESRQPLESRPQTRSAAAGPTSDAFDRACVDLLHGRTPEGERAIKALRDACGSLMSGRAEERIAAERRQREVASAREQLRLQAEGRVQPGRSAAQPEPGQGVRAAFGQAASELGSGRRSQAMGMRGSGPVGFTLMTNPLGWFSGLGVNAELFGAIGAAPRFSWVAGARYSETDASNGNASTFGAMGGVDLFVVGRNNEGLRIGPRMEVAAGRERFQGSTTFARLGFSGEVGYNFIASNGISGLLAAGVGGRIAGDDQNDDFASFVGGEFGPYAKIGVGFSW